MEESPLSVAKHSAMASILMDGWRAASSRFRSDIPVTSFSHTASHRICHARLASQLTPPLALLMQEGRGTTVPVKAGFKEARKTGHTVRACAAQERQAICQSGIRRARQAP